MGAVSISFTNKIVKDEERKYLRTLPAHIKIEFQLNEDKLNLLLVHGSPRKINEYLFEDRDEKSLVRIMHDAGADIMCFGHTHKPYHRILNDPNENKDHFRHAINIGSVGKPKDGNPKGCYVLLTINADSSIENKETIQAEFIRFDYDIEKAAKAVEDSPLPNGYAEMLANSMAGEWDDKSRQVSEDRHRKCGANATAHRSPAGILSSGPSGDERHGGGSRIGGRGGDQRLGDRNVRPEHRLEKDGSTPRPRRSFLVETSVCQPPVQRRQIHPSTRPSPDRNRLRQRDGQ